MVFSILVFETFFSCHHFYYNIPICDFNYISHCGFIGFLESFLCHLSPILEYSQLYYLRYYCLLKYCFSSTLFHSSPFEICFSHTCFCLAPLPIFSDLFYSLLNFSSYVFNLLLNSTIEL